MALKTLAGIKELDGFPVSEVTLLGDIAEDTKGNPILIDHENNLLMFKLQNGPVKEAGVNGCQVDTIIEAARLMLQGLNMKFPCKENTEALEALGSARVWLKMRQGDRMARGVEGRSEA